MTAQRIQTTVKDRTEYGIGAEGQAYEWELLPWLVIEQSIRKLRQRIFRATREQKWNVVRSLTKLMLRSYFNLLLSVQRVTQKNKGKETAGVDKELALTPERRMALVRTMGKYTLWKAMPTRRVYIPKPGKPGQERPLGIPTIRNRVSQAMLKNALEPCWEAQFESNSYGFRPGRSIHDAMAQCWLLLAGHRRRPWILDADLKSAFDEISHDHILEAIGPVPGRELLKQWLAAGYVEAEMLHATESGVPQGGVISPLLLNVALHGLQNHLGKKYGYVRYADDFMVCANTREEIEAVRLSIEDWLKPRGLILHQEKTRIVHVDDGFNFFGFYVRRYGGKCLIKPQKENVLTFLAELRKWLNEHKEIAAENVISHFNPRLRGWANNYRHMVSKDVFSYVTFQLFKMLWKWCLRRHPKKGKDWVRAKYFTSQKNVAWTFHAKRGDRTFYLFNVAYVPIERHVKVKGTASPDDPALQEYWKKRKEARREHRRKVTTKAPPSPAGSDARAV
jgi:RNA-directed DNA polymerase